MKISQYRNIMLAAAIGLLAACLLAGDAAAARARVSVPARANLSLECIAQAAKRHGVPLAGMLGILATEGGQPGEALDNRNGTWDLGPFQINTCHVRELMGIGLAPEDVLADSCLNARAAAWLLRRELQRSGGNVWEALGAYHSRTPHLHRAYVNRLKRNLAILERGNVGLLIEYANGRRRTWQ